MRNKSTKYIIGGSYKFPRTLWAQHRDTLWQVSANADYKFARKHGKANLDRLRRNGLVTTDGVGSGTIRPAALPHTQDRPQRKQSQRTKQPKLSERENNCSDKEKISTYFQTDQEQLHHVPPRIIVTSISHILEA